MTGNNFIDVVVNYVRHTDRALVVKNNDKEVWLTRNSVKFDDRPGTEPDLFDDLNKNESILLEVQEWLAELKELKEVEHEK